MAALVANIFIRIGVELVGAVITQMIQESRSSKRTNTAVSSTQKQRNFSTRASPAVVKQPRAVLLVSSNITFGNDCERLINIAFQTSQTFPKMMGTVADVTAHLQKELVKLYPGQSFHIIIGENQKLGFSVDDAEHFAEVEQERYRVLIFSTKQNSGIKLDAHDANSQMLLKWQ